MIKETSMDAMQRKLGTFLSLSYDAGISMDIIDETLYKSPYFDFLEENRADEFIDDSYEDIVEKVFGIKLRLAQNDEANTELLWVGFSYIDLAIRMKKPLRQLFLLCPPSSMLALFNPYHEMNETALCDCFQKEIYKTSILRTLLNIRKMNVPTLAYYCGCSVPLIWSYCVSNDHLFAASERIIASIAEALNVSSNLFKEKSSFIYYSSAFLFDQGFINLLGESFSRILGIKLHEASFVYLNLHEGISSADNHAKTAIVVTYLTIEEGVIKEILDHFDSLITVGAVSAYYKVGPKSIKKKNLNQDLVDLSFKCACKKNTLI